MGTGAGHAAGDRRRDAGPGDLPAVRPPGHLRRGRRGGRGGAALRLADDRPAGAGVRGGRSRRRPARGTRSRSAPGRRRCTARRWRPGLGPGDEAITTPMTLRGDGERRAVCGGDAASSPTSTPDDLLISPGRGRGARSTPRDPRDHRGRLRRASGRLRRAAGGRRRGARRAADAHRRRGPLARRDPRRAVGRARWPTSPSSACTRPRS